MNEAAEAHNSPESHISQMSETKEADTFDDLKTADNSSRMDTFDDVHQQGPEKRIDTFDDIKAGEKKNNSDVKAEAGSFEGERLSNSATKLNIDEGRHRTYVAAKEGYDNVPVKLNDIYTQKDDKNMIDRRGVTHASFDKDVLNSEDMQNMMKEHDFKQWEQGQVEHKGFTYSDHVKEFERLHECQEAIKNGHSPDEIGNVLGKEHAETYKRFYETKPIKIDREIKID